MVKIQLETGYLDVKEGADFPLNFGVAEIRDLTKRSGTFSKSITLVGSKNNHDLLNHYYDVNIEAGTFNINTLTKCTVLQNDIPILSDASLQLTAVNKRQWSVEDENKIEYTVLIKDAQADFFTKIDNGELTDLDFSDLNHIYSSANVVASWSNTSGYVYPLGLTPNNTIPLSEFRPAVYLKEYWDRIHAVAGFQYEWAELSNGLFDKLVIPFNGEALTFDYSDFQVDANVTTALTFTQGVGTNVTSTSGDITTWTETQDGQNLFNPTTGVYSVPFYIAPGQAVTYRVTIDFDFNLINSTVADAYLVDMLSSPFTARYRYQPQYLLRTASSIVAQSGLGTLGQFTFNEGVALPSGTTTLGSTSITFEIAASNLLPTDILTNRLRVFVDSVSTVRWKDGTSTTDADVQINYELDVTSLSIEIVPSSNILQFGATVEMNDFLPKKVKQKDLIKSVCTMYNLLVEPDEDNPNKLIYKSRDAYYDAGTEKDWTQKLAKNIDHQILFLPELSAKKLQLSYKPDKDEPNVTYEDATKEVYGQLEFTYDNEYVRGVDRKELIFSPTPSTNNTFNAVVPMIGGGAPQTNIRLLIHNGTETCNPFDIYDFGTTGQTNLTSYPVCLHFDNPYNPTFDINFAVCDYYFYPNITLTNNNLYNLYWRRTVNQINKGKMFVGLFDLNENDIHNLRLNDKIYLRDSWWHINKVVDYNPTKDLLTKVELISADDDLDLPRFLVQAPLNTAPVGKPIAQLIDRFYERNNVNLSKGSVVVKGIGNVVNEGLTGFVEGDYKSINESGYFGDLRLGALSDGNLVFVSSKEDFPAPVGGRINLLDNVTYFITTTVDLEGDRLIGGVNTTIIGGSSENCRLKSTGLAAALITSAYSLPIRNITIEAALALDLVGDGVTTALDWFGVNFTDCAVIGKIEDYSNFIMQDSAFLNSGGLTFDGTIGTIGFTQCLFDMNAGNTGIILPATLTVSRRFRATYSSFVVGATETGIDASTSLTIPTESYILDTVNFGGAGTKITGLDDDDNRSLFINCLGIKNTAVNGQLYMQANATATTVAATNTFYKVAGTTTASADNSKISHSNNRLTFDAIISRRYLIQCNLSFTAGNNNVCEFGFYDSQIAGIRTPSRTKATGNAGGRAENVSFFCIVTATSGDFIEVHAANTSAVTDITVTDMNFIITEIK